VSKLHFRPKVKFAPETAQIGFPPCPVRHPPRARGNARMGNTCPGRGGHARMEHPTARPRVLACWRRRGSRPRLTWCLSRTRSRLSLAHPCLCRAPGRAPAMATHGAPAAASVSASSCLLAPSRTRSPSLALALTFAFPLALLLLAGAAAAAVAGRAAHRSPPWPAVLGPLQAELWAPCCAYALAGAPRRCQPPPTNAGQLLCRRRRSCAPARRSRARPGRVRPPRCEPRPPASARGPPGAPPPLHHRRRAPYDRHRRATVPLLCSVPRKKKGKCCVRFLLG
jgi:hypothetical protein